MPVQGGGAAVMERTGWREMGDGEKVAFGVWSHTDMEGREEWRSE